MKQQFKNLYGERFGRWTVIDDIPDEASGERKWRCRCDCGTERQILERSLLFGGSLSCGCLRDEKFRSKVVYDLTGKTFGELTVLKEAEVQKKNGGVWWTCKCSCGNTYDVPATLLVNGRRTHCPDRSHKRNYASTDIAGQHFHRLTAMYPTKVRDAKGSVVWHCKCDCGNEIDVPYNSLVYSSMKSCGCQKKENDLKLQENLTRVDGTSIDHIRSQTIPTSNTTGYRGVYLIRGKYVAKIVFQQKQYHLGSYKNIDDAVKARRKAEILVFDETAAYYEKWKTKAETNEVWAKENPIKIDVKRVNSELTVSFSPSL